MKEDTHIQESQKRVYIHVNPEGRTGNKLFSLSFAHYLQSLIPNSCVVSCAIPELRIDMHPDWEPLLQETADFEFYGQHHGIENLEEIISKPNRLLLRTSALGMRPEYYQKNKLFLKTLLNSALGQPTTGSDTFGKVLCHIRGGDLWEPRIRKSGYALHGNYAALPISYYKQI